MLKILIVDDNAEIVKLLKSSLQSFPEFGVDGCLAPAEALELMKLHRYDIVITDIELPQMEGTDLVVALKKIKPIVQVIVITAYSNMGRVLRCLELGVVDYFAKPFKIAQIIEALLYIQAKIKRWRETIQPQG